MRDPRIETWGDVANLCIVALQQDSNQELTEAAVRGVRKMAELLDKQGDKRPYEQDQADETQGTEAVLPRGD